MYGMSGGGMHLDRNAQIDELLNTHPQCKFTPERGELDFALQLKRRDRSDIVIIRIKLPTDFPIEAPRAVVITENVRHPWIDPNGLIIGCSSLNLWTSRSRLATVVSDILNQFISMPPQIGSMSSYSSSTSSPSPSSSSSSTPYPSLSQRRQSTSTPPGARASSSGYQPRTSMPSRQPYGMSTSSSSYTNRNKTDTSDQDSADMDGVFIPPVPDRIDELDGKTQAELEKLLNDEDELEKFFKSLPMPTMTNEFKSTILKSNVAQAEKNLSFKENIEQLQAEVLKLQEEAVPKWNAYKELETRQNESMRRYDPLRLLTQLESSCNKLDDESELLASEFLAEEISLPDFIKRQIELRKLYHLRKAKAERFRIELKRSASTQ
ncbi:Hypothetical Protein FCC1311_012062 [Hondaea fermentalgiana]|uniref:VPS37 C-terminal domain-containing protein n=1 Tax=Hondaea fermentalgiana TaxID=2315210 RepID=A0A2R5G3T6_9STRA|nr:Hypothetical Protein FCC1311_012062 [Hondaea fermentalgiana]|eukprot:GBG24989.1 Hypothetical Protein FCC1311_012062 [Hondaea fermentalgiana]